MNDEEERSLKRIIREILGGKPVTDYPIGMLPKIKNYLYDIKEKAISLGQNDRVKLIQRAFIQINEFEKKYQKSVKSNEKLEDEQKKLSEEELESMINKMIAGEEIPPFDVKLIPPLIKCIKKRIKFHIQKDEFELAQNYEDLHQILFTELRNGKTNGQKEWLQKKIMDRLEKAEQKLKELEEIRAEKLDQNEKMTSDAIETINQQNQIELDNFDAETQGPLPPFSKTFSSELQNLRETQKKLIICKRFKEAADVRDKIKEIIEIELEGIEDKHFRSRESRREQILDMHYQRIDCILTKSESQRINIDDFYGKKIDSLRNQIEFLERQLDLINSSKRYKTQFDPAISFDIPPEEYQPKVLKSKTPLSVRQLSMRDPWSLFFDSSKRLNVTKIDELAEPRWKTIEPRQTDTEVYSQFISSLITTPKSWDRVHNRKINSARLNRKSWQSNPSNYTTNRRNKSEEKRKMVSMKINYNDFDNEENGLADNANKTTPNRIKKKRSRKGFRSSSLARTNGIDIYSAEINPINNQSNRNYSYYSGSNINNKKELKSNTRSSTINSNYNYNSSNNYKKLNAYDSSNNKISIANSSNYNNLVSNFESASTFNKNSTTNSTRQSDKYSSLSGANSSSKVTAKTATLDKKQSSLSSENNQRVSINSSSANYISNNSSNNSKTSVSFKKSNKTDSIELSSNIYYNGLTYTQTIDARRNKAIQTKKKKSLANLYEKSDFEKFCQTVPPSRKEQLPSYL